MPHIAMRGTANHGRNVCAAHGKIVSNLYISLFPNIECIIFAQCMILRCATTGEIVTVISYVSRQLSR